LLEMMNHIRRRNVCVRLLSGRGRHDHGHEQYENGAEKAFATGINEFVEVQAGQLCDIKQYDKLTLNSGATVASANGCDALVSLEWNSGTRKPQPGGQQTPVAP